MTTPPATNCQGNRPGTVLATATGTVTTNDMSAAGSLTFTPDGANAHLGKDLGIRLIKSTNSVLYDNIRLVTGHDMLPSPASGVHHARRQHRPQLDQHAAEHPGDRRLRRCLVRHQPGSPHPGRRWRCSPAPPTSTLQAPAPTTGASIPIPMAIPTAPPSPAIFSSSSSPTPTATACRTPTNWPTPLPPRPPRSIPRPIWIPDGLTNAQEYFYGTNPNDNDTDDDTLLDGPELTGVGLRPATSPVDADSDDDGLSDGVETNTGTWVSAANTGTNPTDADWDNDGLKDGVETNTGIYVDRFNTGTNPFLADTDTDGAGDWYEATATFTNPNSNAETSHHSLSAARSGSARPGATNKPVKVYIMAGQSNTVGIGQVNGTAPGTLETIAKRENKFPNLVDGSNNWTKRNDVIYKGVVTATAAGPLDCRPGSRQHPARPGTRFRTGHGLVSRRAGPHPQGLPGQPQPRLGFPASRQRAMDLGGQHLRRLWRQPGKLAHRQRHPGPGGWYAGKQYDDCFLAESDMGMIRMGRRHGLCQRRHWSATTAAAYTSKSAHTSDASSEPGTGASWTTYWNVYTTVNAHDVLANGVLQNLPTTGNNLNGRTYEIAGFCWWQGHKDQDGTNNIYRHPL